MKRLVIDARESGTTTGRYIDKLLEHLHGLAPQYEVLVLTKTPRVEYIKQIAPDFKVVGSNYKEFTFREQLGFTWQLYRLKAGLVHFTMTQQPLLYFKKSVTTVHDLTTARFRNPTKNWLVYKIKQWVYRGLIVWVAHKSRNLIVPTQYVKTDLVKFARANKNKITVTYEAADKIDKPAEFISKLKDKKFIMYVGRPLPHKNLGRLVDAFVLLQKNHPALWLVLVGKKDVLYECYEQEITKRGLQNVLFTGFVGEEQLRWLYENMEAYVFPSLSEGFGLPGLEAMQYGAPVVSSNATCLPEIYGGAAHYFDPLSVEDMAGKIDDVLSDDKLREELVKKGHEQVRKYSWEKMAAQTLETYNKTLKT